MFREGYWTYTSLITWFGIGSVSAVVNVRRNEVRALVGSVGKDADVFLA